ncbi:MULTISPECIES: urease accessory protein UreF [unclassified Cyanobium]|uniref:urease accessory protein UreF n=1 Tax=unclassified Cyanobium TaxID=2627006 RepID=UPI0020CDDC12|nr:MULTISPECIES: urease accessory UreF family protein [unclassified Cyanobium]MCP9776564.1 urease accessory protein UreF [Cyanobium sp. Tous-M-B4]MCP9877767.1 urease accessory protein UreF [Cyanobium sp. A2C-AMD]
MTTSRLRLFQLISPALPVGAFSYSEGLEVQVQRGLLLDGAGVRAWLEAELQRGTLALEAASLPGLLLAEPAELRERDSWLLALREAAEVRAQQRQMGASLLGLLADLGFNPPALNLAWPAAFALAGRALEVAATELVEAYLYGWVANQLSAALRLVPLGPTEAQRLQLGLAPLIAERALELVAADPDQLWSGGVGAGLAQLRHAELYSRLFRS